MYELFLLGKLLARPWYGYEFQQALSGFAGPARQISWGTIYPLFQRLQKQGSIRPVPQRISAGAPSRNAYAITAAGKKRFHVLMSEEEDNDGNYRETFRVKLGNFSRISLPSQQNITRAYLQRVCAVQAHTTKMQKLVQHAPAMDEDERSMILRAIRHERSLADAEIKWLRKEMADLL